MNIVDNTRRLTDKTVGLVIPTACRHDFSPFIARLEKRFLTEKVMPTFFIVKGGKFENREISALQHAAAHVKLIEGPAPAGERMRIGFDSASKNDCCMFTADDFDHLERHISKLASKIGNGNEFVAGNWDKSAHQYLPYLSFLNESSVCMLVTYANPKHPADVAAIQPGLEGFFDFRSNARKLGTWSSTYFGLLGFVSSKWEEIRQSIDAIFPGDLQASGAGFEVALSIVANSIGLKMDNMGAARRFEHPLLEHGSIEMAKFRAGRIFQFNTAASLVESYAAKTAPEKNAVISNLKNEVLLLLESAEFAWPPPNDAWPVPTKWNSPITTTY